MDECQPPATTSEQTSVRSGLLIFIGVRSPGIRAPGAKCKTGSKILQGTNIYFINQRKIVEFIGSI